MISSNSVPVTAVASACELQLDRSRLDIVGRSRTSRLPWRGQFSPELVEYILETVCPDAAVVLDPFCGSGTVLFEVAQRGGTGLGAEVNPAAWHLASLASLSAMSAETHKTVKRALTAIREGLADGDGLFSEGSANFNLLDVIASDESDTPLRSCIAAAVLLGMGDKPGLTNEVAVKGLLSVEKLVDELASYAGTGTCHLADARALPLEANTVDAVITSPPYINVFNYHQNYRPAAELLGWRPLDAARSEIGANRKHRANRFLTVVQYCLDMAQALDELTRVCTPGAPVVFVVGRESNVLGASFRNADLLQCLMERSSGLEIRHRTERVFTNRFGQRIYEDVIIGRAIKPACIDRDFARATGANALSAALATVPETNRAALEAALFGAGNVQPSPLLALNRPGF